MSQIPARVEVETTDLVVRNIQNVSANQTKLLVVATRSDIPKSLKNVFIEAWFLVVAFPGILTFFNSEFNYFGYKW